MRAAAAQAEPPPGAHAPPGWSASLELDFAVRAGRTVLVHRRHRGPLMVQSAFYPEGPVCHVYVLHPPGGVVGGDTLHTDVRVQPGAHALLTTPASGKFYRSDGAVARQRQALRVAAGAVLEWLPAESIVFQGARCELATEIDLEPGARLLAWDAWILGRPACAEGFAHGTLRQHQALRVDGRPVLVERNHAHGGSAWLRGPWGLGGHAAAATLIAYPGDADALAAARGAIDARAPGLRAAATIVDGVLACRALASGLMPLRAQLERWWRALRPPVVGRAPAAPRIWAT